MMRIVAFSLAVTLAVASVVHLYIYLPSLPETVATKFGNGGKPIGFMSKPAYAALMTGLLLGIPVFIIVLGRVTRWLPNELINVPNKEYWLHPERREATLDTTETFCLWMGASTSALLLVLNHMTVVANLEKRGLYEPAIWILLAAYLMAVIGGIVWLYRRFPKPPATPPSPLLPAERDR